VTAAASPPSSTLAEQDGSVRLHGVTKPFGEAIEMTAALAVAALVPRRTIREGPWTF